VCLCLICVLLFLLCLERIIKMMMMMMMIMQYQSFIYCGLQLQSVTLSEMSKRFDAKYAASKISLIH